MIILIGDDGDEQLIPDCEFTGLFTELRDLLQRQVSAARAEQRNRDAEIVQKYIDDPGSFFDPEPKEILKRLKKEIEG